MSLKEIGPFVHAKGPIFKAFLLRCLSIILRYNDISPVAEAYKLIIHCIYKYLHFFQPLQLNEIIYPDT